MNARHRINGLTADRATLSLGIEDRGVAIPGEHQGLSVCEHAGGSFDESPAGPAAYQDRAADIKDKGLLWLFGRFKQRAP
jgi:hypothetical protein